MFDSLISLVKNNNFTYPDKKTLFRPSKKYPEYLFDDVAEIDNTVYDAVRESFYLLGLDKENYNTRFWNPLSEFVKPGNNVLLKPNLVMHKNQNKLGGELCLYTQPSVVAAVIDYVIIALKGKGKIIVGDAPMQECDFDYLLKDSGYSLLIDYYKKKNIDIEIVDFRELTSVVKNGLRCNQINEMAKGIVIDLGTESEFYKVPSEKLKKARITNYDPRILPTHHHDNTHEYYVSEYVLNADVIINLPKPKCHRKAGMTSALKNFIGANVRKEFLPHHIMGSVKEKGDEYLTPSRILKYQSKCADKCNIFLSEKKRFKAFFMRLLSRLFGFIARHVRKETYSDGSWYGNQTISKTICDLNKIINYANKDGVMCEKKQRTIFNIADMIIAGEKEGPVLPSPKNIGIIVSGFNLVCFDEVIATIMGFDKDKIPTLVNSRKIKGKFELVNKNDYPLVVSNEEGYNNKDLDKLRATNLFDFEPSSGWKGHIELNIQKI